MFLYFIIILVHQVKLHENKKKWKYYIFDITFKTLNKILYKHCILFQLMFK